MVILKTTYQISMELLTKQITVMRPTDLECAELV